MSKKKIFLKKKKLFNFFIKYYLKLKIKFFNKKKKKKKKIN